MRVTGRQTDIRAELRLPRPRYSIAALRGKGHLLTLAVDIQYRCVYFIIHPCV